MFGPSQLDITCKAYNRSHIFFDQLLVKENVAIFDLSYNSEAKRTMQTCPWLTNIIIDRQHKEAQYFGKPEIGNWKSDSSGQMK